MRPRQSGGGTANDPVDFTLSDTEPVLSDAPVPISKGKAKPFQSSGSDVVELINGKRVRPTKEVRDVGEASTSQLIPDVPEAKRSRQAPSDTIAPAASTSTAPVKKKTTARKSTQHISSAHRLRWEATQETVTAAAAESNEDISHEEAMRQAAAERRRSQSARKPSHSPTKTNPEPGLGPSTRVQPTQSYIKHRALEDTNNAGAAPEARVEAPSPKMVHPESSPDPLSGPTGVQVKKDLPESDSPVTISAPVSSSGRVKPSPFQISDTPGSWGSAIPMSVPPSARPRSHTPKSTPMENIPEAGPSNSQKVPVQSNPTSKAQSQIHAEAPVQSQSSKPVRKGPTWKTAESPPPAPSQKLPVDPLPSQPIDTDELDMQSSFNTAESSLEATSLPVSHDIGMPPEETPAFERTSPLPGLPSQQLDVEPDNDTPPVVKGSLIHGTEATPSNIVFESIPTSRETDLQPEAGQQSDSTIRGTEIIGSGANVKGVVGTASSSVTDADRVGSGRGGFSMAGAATAAAYARWAKFRAAKEAAGESVDAIKEGDTPMSFESEVDLLLPPSAELQEPEEPMSFNAEIDMLLPSSNPVDEDVTMDGQPSGDLPSLDAALLDLLPTDKMNDVGDDQAIEIDDLAASLPEEMEQIDLTRSRESSSGGSFEEIPAEIARSQIVFSRPIATQSSRRSGPSQPVANEDPPDTPDAPEQRISLSTPDNDAIGDIAHLKAPHTERAKSSSSSSSGSPSKRLSSRLASRTITPVYNFGSGAREPIKWRQIVEMDGESDVEDLLRAPSRAESSGSGSSSMTIDGVERTLTATFNIPIVDSPPPPERRSRAIREFDTQLIDEWNKLSPGLTHNPPLHRLIFESYIERCVDNEPEIKVYNSVDFESIPPNFEFQYSNEMLYNEDVPEPELGLGCDCEGGCSVTSDTCSCLKRQRLYNFEINEDFAYDEHGKLKQPVPIWECGPNCGCPPECMNRVVQRGRTNEALIDLFKTKRKGWGVRARNAIPTGTFLGIYSGEVIPEAESERRGAIYEKAGRTYLFDCDGYHISNPPKGLEEVDPRLAVLARDSARRAALAAVDEDYPGAYNAYSIDAFHYGNFTRFFNHCCNPNLQIVQAYVNDFHPERPLLVIFTLRDISAGEELCISYKGLPDEEEVVPDKTKKGGKRRKIKKPKTTAAVHVSKKNGDHKDRDTCFCGAKNCDGIMFNRSMD